MAYDQDDDEGYHPEQRQRTHPADTPDRRLQVILLDTSGSMGPPIDRVGPATSTTVYPIDQLNDALRRFLGPSGIRSDQQYTLNGEIAIAEFCDIEGEKPVEWLELGKRVHEGSDIYWASEVGNFDSPLQPGGRTPIGAAIKEGAERIVQRLHEWDIDNISRAHRPILIALTDGKPTDSPQVLADVADYIHSLEDEGDLVLWIAHTTGGDDRALRLIADKGNLISLENKSISSFIQLMTMSRDEVAASTSRTAAQIYRDVSDKWKYMDE